MAVQTQTTMFPIQFLVPFWEYRGPALVRLLEQAKRSGIHELFIYPPWSLLESDITHSLPKFLEQAVDQGFTVRIYASLPPASSMPLGGMPRDLLKNEAKLARDSEGRPFSRWSAPEPHLYPSLYDGETQKRFLAAFHKLEGLVKGALASQKNSRGELILCGGMSAFDLSVGVNWNRFDRSSAAQADFEKLKFSDPLKADLLNQHQHAKSNLERRLSDQFLRKNLPFEKFAWECPEVHPYALGNAISALEANVLGQEDILEADPIYGRGHRDRWCWYVEEGALSRLSGPQRQSLILRSLLLYGGPTSGVVLPVREWFSCSEKFKGVALSLAKRIASEAIVPVTDLVVCEGSDVPHAVSPLFRSLRERHGSRVRRASPVDSMSGAQIAPKLMWFTEDRFIEREEFPFIQGFIENGGVVVMPKNPRAESSVATKISRLGRGGGSELKLNLPLPVSIVEVGRGKIIKYAQERDACFSRELADMALKIAGLEAIGELRAGAGMEVLWFYRDPKTQPIDPLHSTSVFIFNGTENPVTSELNFSGEVSFYDDARVYQGQGVSEELKLGHSQSFEMSVPAYGVISLAIDGMGHDLQESVQAREHEGVLANQLLSSARSGLSDQEGGFHGSTFL